jgi:hypothetical protein
MNRILLVTALLAASYPAAGAEGDHWVKFHFLSRHLGGEGVWYDNEGQPQEWNQFNPGAGYAYELADILEVTAGVFENSHNKFSLYGGAKWHTGYDNWIDFGVTVGLVTGYEVTQAVDTPVTPFILPEFSFRLADITRGQAPRLHVRLDIGYLPGIKTAQAIGDPVDLVTGTIRVMY